MSTEIKLEKYNTEALNEIYSNLTITYSPEFLRSNTAEQDFLNQTYMIFGGVDPDGFWQEVFTPILEKCKLYFIIYIKKIYLL